MPRPISAAFALFSFFAFLAVPAPPHARADERELLPAAVRELISDEQDRMLLNAEGFASVGDPARFMRAANEQATEFRPEAKSVFEVKSYWVDAEKWHGFEGANFSPWLRDQMIRVKNGRKQFRLLVHPESQKFWAPHLVGAEEAAPFRALATASSRTLLVWEKGKEQRPFFAKLSLDKVIQTLRLMRPAEIVRSIGTNNILAASRKILPKSFHFFPEVFGLSPKGGEYGGMLLREIPREIMEGKVSYSSFFSLLAPGPHGEPPRLAQMIRNSGKTARELLTEQLIRPFARQWIELQVEHGINMEPHAQNLGPGVDKATGTLNGEFMHKDFGGFSLDLDFRREAGLPEPKSLPALRSIAEDYSQDEVPRRTSRSIDLHFKSGALYNVESRLGEWMRNGWIPQEEVPEGSLGASLKKELSAVLAEKYQVTGYLQDDLSNLRDKILEARRLSALRAPPPTARQKCAGFFRNLVDAFWAPSN